MGSAPEPDPAAASALSAPRSRRPSGPALLILQDREQEQTQQFPTLSSSFLPTRTVKKTTYFAVSFYGNYSQGKTIHRAFPKHCITSISCYLHTTKKWFFKFEVGLQLGAPFTSPSCRQRSEVFIS